MVAEGDKRTLQDVENFYNTFFEEILVSVADFIWGAVLVSNPTQVQSVEVWRGAGEGREGIQGMDILSFFSFFFFE